MGTRYEDQPPELWAGPESLDPTPVWKQFALIGLFLVVGLVLVGGVAAFAAAPQIVAPPAMVPGERLVLSTGALPPVVTGDGDRPAPRRRRAPLPPRARGGGAGGRLPSAVGAASGRARVSRRVRDLR